MWVISGAGIVPRAQGEAEEFSWCTGKATRAPLRTVLSCRYCWCLFVPDLTLVTLMLLVLVSLVIVSGAGARVTGAGE